MKRLLFSLLLLAGCGSLLEAQTTINDPDAVRREISGFHGIEVATGIELYLTTGTTEAVAVSASSPEFKEKIITEVKDGILKIYYENKLKSINRKKESKQLRAYVSCKILNQLYVNTGAYVKVEGVLNTDMLEMKVNTGAQVNGAVAIQALDIKQNTGSKIVLSGKVEKLDINSDTGSKFSGEGLLAGSCNISVSTGAVVAVHAEKQLDVKASTGGIVRYKGTAAIREIKTSSGGSVTKI